MCAQHLAYEGYGGAAAHKEHLPHVGPRAAGEKLITWSQASKVRGRRGRMSSLKVSRVSVTVSAVAHHLHGLRLDRQRLFELAARAVVGQAVGAFEAFRPRMRPAMWR